MRLRHIEVFHAVMRTGSLSKAAELLCVSQPAVSKVLAHAERSAGLMLFNRVHGRLQPTREAELLFSETQKLQANLDSIRDLARNLALQPEGHLRIGCLPSLGLSVIPSAVEAFRVAYPRVSMRIQTRHTEELLNALLTRELDLAVALSPPARPGIASVELGRTPVVCVGPPADDREDTDDQPTTLQAVVEGDWISIGDADPLGEMIGNALEALGLDGRAPSVEAHTWHVARALAARGIGHALLDELTASSGAEAVSVRPLAPPLSVGVFALWRDGGLSSKAGNAFVDVLRARFA
ncbi:LysR family transcriptional regulator [Paraburkholderia phymatum]|uniref:Transcriptional regulator, LysR family n=1 Tax=Paraburkholderia phymatum (strain DSM 17167 / CIP 108236 / LMG 21445 / STM815) TaxID=391038 RepID=B2JRF0_PARP8|nr:LysR family transcriptional regulator [Paraburkholderia phymatum]ACC73816.1 transcriptional regulator, LysR family [Paraburkholderia phymatum STM815]